MDAGSEPAGSLPRSLPPAASSCTEPVPQPGRCGHVCGQRCFGEATRFSAEGTPCVCVVQPLAWSADSWSLHVHHGHCLLWRSPTTATTTVGSSTMPTFSGHCHLHRGQPAMGGGGCRLCDGLMVVGWGLRVMRPRVPSAWHESHPCHLLLGAPHPLVCTNAPRPPQPSQDGAAHTPAAVGPWGSGPWGSGPQGSLGWGRGACK